MGSLLTTEDPQGGLRFRPLAVPLIIALIGGSVAAAMAVQGTGVGAGLGMAVGALAATALIVFAVRARPRERVEVAEGTVGVRRVLVLATSEATPEAAQRIAELATGADDVRLVIPVPSHRLERWLSAEDDARAEGQRWLAHSAGALVAAGLPVSGSLGDPDPAQALEDELRDYPADEVVLLADGDDDPLAEVRGRLGLPLKRVTVR
ncbi:MAG: hypothetical protein ACRDK5_07370 [Solirubrobacterales bacterium]